MKEYIVWQVLENQLHWFSLHEGEYLPLRSDADGIIRSQVTPGLWLAVAVLLTGDMVQVLAVLQAGLNSPEHTEFLNSLNLL